MNLVPILPHVSIYDRRLLCSIFGRIAMRKLFGRFSRQAFNKRNRRNIHGSFLRDATQHEKWGPASHVDTERCCQGRE